uniref:Uncharacterized protein n=1 Tax=Knipowitschia caucasica TaxID=637954 RepID=A0AAV2LQ53_KNICA
MTFYDSVVDVHWSWSSRVTSAEIHHHLLGLPRVDEEVVPLTPVHKVLYNSSVLCVIVLGAESDDGRVVGDLLEDTAVRVVSEVRSVEGEEERREDSSLGAPPHCRSGPQTQSPLFSQTGVCL